MSSSTRFKLSPSEQKALILNEMRERRKTRLLQVRQQEKEFARQIRNNIRLKKEEERKLLEQHIKTNLAREHEEELRQLEETLMARRQQVGQAQRDAQTIEQEEQRLQELRLLLSSRQKAVAKKRETLALQELMEAQLRERAAKDNAILTRNHVLVAEKERAKVLSKKQLKTPSLLIMDLEANPSSNFSTRRVQGVEGFASTYFHLPDNLVHRETTPTDFQINALQAAEQALMEDEEHKRKQTVLRDEQQVKAQLRHKHALAQVKLEKEKKALLKDLSMLAREDRTHRQEILQHLPANLFQPVQQRLQEREMQQYELEHAFEKLLSKTRATSTREKGRGGRKSGGDEGEGGTKVLKLSEELCTPSPILPDVTESIPPLSPSPPPPPHTSKNPLNLTIQTLTPSTLPSMSITEQQQQQQQKEETREEKRRVNGCEGEAPSLTISTIPPLKDTTSSSSQSTNISRLVGLIRTQQDTWNKRNVESKDDNDDSLVKSERERRSNDSLSISTLSSSQGPLDVTADHINESIATPPTASRDSGKVTLTSSLSLAPPPRPSPPPPAELTIETIDETISQEEEEENEGQDQPVSRPPPAYYPIYYYPTVHHQYYPYYPQSSPFPTIYPSSTVYSQHQPPNNEAHIPPITESRRDETPAMERSGTAPFEASSLSSSALISTAASAPMYSSPIPTFTTTQPSPGPMSTLTGLSLTKPLPPQSPLIQSVSLDHSLMHQSLDLTLSPHSPPPVTSDDSTPPPPPVDLNESSCNDNQQRSDFIQSLLVSLQESKDDNIEETGARASSTSTNEVLSTSSSVTPSKSDTSRAHPLQTNVLLHSPPSPSLPSSLSLQEAFRHKKQSFIKQSQTRVSSIGEKARERENRAKKSKSTKLVKFSSPVLQEESESAIKHTPPSIHKGFSEPTMAKKSMSLKEMQSKSLHSSFQEKSERQQEYAKNREKARLFCQMLRNKIVKRQDSS